MNYKKNYGKKSYPLLKAHWDSIKKKLYLQLCCDLKKKKNMRALEATVFPE